MSKKFGKRESSILLFILVLACLVFLGWGNMDVSDFESKKQSSGKALIGGEFVLTDQNGAEFSSAQLQGKKALIFFGFTNCPAVCPTSMAVISAVMEQVDADEVQPVLISVDPERDTPEAMKVFLEDFYPTFIGLTGDAEKLKAVKRAYKVYSAKSATANELAGEYDMDHSSLIYLMDEDGEYLLHFNGTEAVEEMSARIRSY